MLAFFYFVQMIINLPKLLIISWNNIISVPKTTGYTLKTSTVSDEISEMWQDSDDVLQRILIVNCTISDVDWDDDVATKFIWELYNGTELLERRSGSRRTEQFRIESQHTHHLTVEVVKTSESGSSEILTETFQKSEPYWISAVGDSFSSGQGNPDASMSSGKTAKWLDESCYRSSKAFPYRIFQSIQHSVLSFFSCSGATVENGILSKNGQLERLEKLIRTRGVSPDLLILTIGGNDIGFTDIISLIQRDTTIESSVDMRFFYVSHQIDRVAAKIKELNISRVVLLDYYDVSRNENGVVDASCGLFGQVSLANLQQAERKILRRLNKLLFKKAAQHDWITVETMEIFGKHGICSKDPLIRSRNESLELQGNEYGSFHPNEEAHRLIGNQILKILEK